MALGQLGLSISYYHSLTYRQFTNTVNGYRKKEDNKSKEQWVMTRKMMFAFIIPYNKDNIKETDLLSFPWEDTTIKKISEEELQKDLEIEEISKNFFSRWDRQKEAQA